MSESSTLQHIKRFYKKAHLTFSPDAKSHVLMLDDRMARTKGRHLLQVPYAALGVALVAEWEGQEVEIRLEQMPLTLMVSSVLDRWQAPEAQFSLQEDMLKYAGSDLLCYRTDAPEALAALQTSHWDPVLSWLNRAHRASFLTSHGIMPIVQPAESIEKIREILMHLPSPWHVVGLHMLTQMFGSVFLALALYEGAFSFEELWAAAHVDEDFQASLWGEDEEARERHAARKKDTYMAFTYLQLCV